MKKFLLAIPALMILVTATLTALAFSDVTSKTSYKTAINWMDQNQIINGYADGTFHPDKCVNRVELLKMLFETLDVDTSAYSAKLFTDTPKGSWYEQYVITGRARGTVQGYKDGSFKPAQCVTRMEAIKMALLEFNDGKIPPQYGEFANSYDIASWPNVDKEWWYKYYLSAFSSYSVGVDHFTYYDADWKKLGVDNDFANPTFNFGPNESMTRKEVAEMLYRLKAMKDNDMGHYDYGIYPKDILVGVCVQEGGVLSENPETGSESCCEGLVPYKNDSESIGQFSTCVDKNNVPLTKQEAQEKLKAEGCYYNPGQEKVIFELEGEKWVISKQDCGGICSIDSLTEEIYISPNPMCMGVNP